MRRFAAGLFGWQRVWRRSVESTDERTAGTLDLTVQETRTQETTPSERPARKTVIW